MGRGKVRRLDGYRDRLRSKMGRDEQEPVYEPGTPEFEALSPMRQLSQKLMVRRRDIGRRYGFEGLPLSEWSDEARGALLRDDERSETAKEMLRLIAGPPPWASRERKGGASDGTGA